MAGSSGARDTDADNPGIAALGTWMMWLRRPTSCSTATGLLRGLGEAAGPGRTGRPGQGGGRSPAPLRTDNLGDDHRTPIRAVVSLLATGCPERRDPTRPWRYSQAVMVELAWESLALRRALPGSRLLTRTPIHLRKRVSTRVGTTCVHSWGSRGRGFKSRPPDYFSARPRRSDCPCLSLPIRTRPRRTPRG